MVVKTVVSDDGTKIWAESKGDTSKPALVWVHGWGTGAVYFDKAFNDPKYLSNLHMIRYDLRGYGLSDKPTTADAYESRRFAEDWAAVVRGFDVAKPLVLGWSLGGLLAADIISAYGPSALKGFVYVSGVVNKGPATPIPGLTEVSLVSIPLVLDNTDVTKAYETAIEGIATLVVKPEEMDPTTRTSWLGAYALCPPAIRGLHVGREVDDKFFEKEGVKDLPILNIHGKEDQRLDFQPVADYLEKIYSNVESHFPEGVAHSPFFEKPETLREPLLKFVARLY